MEGKFQLSKNLTSLKFMKQAEAQKLAKKGAKRKLQIDSSPSTKEEVGRLKIQKAIPETVEKIGNNFPQQKQGQTLKISTEIESNSIDQKQSQISSQKQLNAEICQQNKNEDDKSNFQDKKLKNIQTEQFQQNQLSMVKQNLDENQGNILKVGRMSFNGRKGLESQQEQIIGNGNKGSVVNEMRQVCVIKQNKQPQRKSWEQMAKELNSKNHTA